MGQEVSTSKTQPGSMSEKSLLGMWIFLVTEVMMFGAFFLVYAQYRFLHNKEFAEASGHLDMLLGSINTAILLTSSLTMAFAVSNAKNERPKWTIAFLMATITLGLVFLGIKSFEYYSHWTEGLYPSSEAHAWLKHPPGYRLFYVLYYTLTALHYFHVAAGLTLITTFIIYRPFAKLSKWSKKIEATGLYWHFVDIVWIFLFPLLYLIGRSK